MDQSSASNSSGSKWQFTSHILWPEDHIGYRPHPQAPGQLLHQEDILPYCQKELKKLLHHPTRQAQLPPEMGRRIQNYRTISHEFVEELWLLLYQNKQTQELALQAHLKIYKPQEISHPKALNSHIEELIFFFLSYLFDLEGFVQKNSPKDPSQLFPNSEQMLLNNQFGLTNTFAHSLDTLLRNVNPNLALEQFRQDPQATFRTENRNRRQVELSILKPEGTLVRSSSTFIEQLMKIRNGKILKTLLLLWEYANQINSRNLQQVSTTELMKRIYKPPKSGYFNQQQKREFTSILRYLETLKIKEYFSQTPEQKQKNRITANEYRLLGITQVEESVSKKEE